MKRRPRALRVFTVLYVLALAVYLAVGLQPVEATQYEVAAELAMPSIGLSTDVTTLELEGHELKTPAKIAGSYSSAQNKTLLIGHSSTVFTQLNEVKLGDKLWYADKAYEVVKMVTLLKEEISMAQVLAATEQDTVVMMTCAGESLGGGDATHRLLVTAVGVE